MGFHTKRFRHTLADGTQFRTFKIVGEPDAFLSAPRQHAAMERIRAQNLRETNRLRSARLQARRNYERDPRNLPKYIVTGRNAPAFIRYCRLKGYKVLSGAFTLDSTWVHSFPTHMVQSVIFPPQPTETIEEIN